MSGISKRWNAVPWLREMQAALDPMRDVRPGMAADELERLRVCFDALQQSIKREGYDVLINIDGTEVSVRRREQQ